MTKTTTYSKQQTTMRPKNPFRQWAQLLVCLGLINYHTSISSQQQPPIGQVNEQGSANAQLNPQTKTPFSAAPNVASVQKVGLAPHDRPACQLPTITAQRRLSNASLGGQSQQLPFGDLQSRPPVALGEKAALPVNGTNANLRSLSAPNLAALQSTGGSAASGKSALARPKFDSSERLRQLRQLLASNNYDAYLVTPNDEHGSEYVTDYDKRLRFISGFTGSHGYALILLDRAVLFTDGRYALQADQELDCNWWLVVSGEPIYDIPLWLKANAAKGIKIATDARLMTLQHYEYLEDEIKKLESEFALITQDLVDVVWNNDPFAADRVLPQEPIFVHPLQFAGNLSWQEKVVRLADSMSKLRARHYVVGQLDDIAWLLNLRGADIPMTPLFKAYLFISRSGDTQPAAGRLSQMLGQQQQQTQSVDQLLATSSNLGGLQAPQVLQVHPSQTIRLTLYADLKKIGQQVREHLHTDNGTVIVHQIQQDQATGFVQPASSQTTRIQVELKDYDVFIMDLRERLSSVRQIQGRLLLNADANVAIHVLAKVYEDRLVVTESLINKLKAVRSDGEVQGMRLAHWRDSLAICMLLSQLESDIGQRGLVTKWTETGAAKELEFYRSLMDHNRGQSFETISAYGAAGAVVHYMPNALDQRLIGNQSTYLLDSGGQYLDGTTDITRTTHYGEPSEFQRETYTRVLMGSVDMMSVIFDQNNRSPYRLNDLIARRHLFEIGLDYAHGTGHGIGAFSLVHEQPYLIEHYSSAAQQHQAIANSKPSSGTSPPVHSEPVPLQANMFTSVEPGYYKANDFGIRLENIVVSQRVNLPAALARPNDRQEQSTRSSSGSSNERQFLRFEPISLVPFEPKLIKLELLSNKQKAWLNSYNLMVRLRMTQQINYYLEKIRNLRTQAVQVQGVSATSSLYQQLLPSAAPVQAQQRSVNHSAELNQIQIGHYNFIRLDGAKFQEKLEQTHKWIMSKTELISLDVDQSLVVSHGKGGASSSQSPHSFRTHSGRRDTDEASTTPIGQKLMLAYMSSMPFNDAKASEAMAELSAEDSRQLNGRDDNNATARFGNQISPGSNSNKCVGLECDLWLLDALNSQARQQRDKIPSKTWQESIQTGSLDNFFPSASSSSSSSSLSSLMDLFQLNGAGNQLIQVNMWSLVALASLVVVQLGVLTYMCRNNLFSGSSSNSHPVAS